MIGHERHDEAEHDDDDGCNDLSGREQNGRCHAERDGCTERNHCEQGGKQTEQRGVRNSCDPVRDSQQDALSEPAQHQPIDRSVDRPDHLQTDILTGRAESASARDPHLLGNGVGIAEQEEQPKQHEAQQHQPVKRLLADLFARTDQPALHRVPGQDRHLPRSSELALPKRHQARSVRQCAEEMRRRDARLPRLLDPLRGGMGILGQRHRDHRHRDHEHEDHRHDHQDRQQTASLFRKPPGQPIEQRPDSDGKNHRPGECRQELMERKQPCKKQNRCRNEACVELSA